MDLDTEIAILSAIVRKLWFKTYFCKMVASEMHLLSSLVQTTQYILSFLQRSLPMK